MIPLPQEVRDYVSNELEAVGGFADECVLTLKEMPSPEAMRDASEKLGQIAEILAEAADRWDDFDEDADK